LENSENNNNFAENKNVNNEISNRSTQEKLGRSNENSVRKEIADRLQRGIETTGKKLEGYDRQDAENRIAFDYARERGLWIDDLYFLGKPFPGGGNENTLALNEETGTLYKSNNLFNSNGTISNLLETIRIHNELFPETRYEIAGFTGIDKGENKIPYIEVVLKQNYISNAMQASPKEIADYMHSLGFKQINEYTFTNGQYTISDLRPRNVLKDENGNIAVIDNIIFVNR
jgi:hypothetical protein